MAINTPTNSYSMGTATVGNNPLPTATKTDLNTFNQSMVNKPASTNPTNNAGSFTGATSVNFLNTPQPSPSVVSNYTMPKQVNDIVTKSTQLGAIPTPKQNTQTAQTTNTATTNAQNTAIDYSTAPYTTDANGTKMYYNPASGQYDQYASTNGVVNYGGVNVPSAALSDPYIKSIIDNQLTARQANKTALDTQLEAIKNKFIQYRDTQNKLNTSAQAGVQNALLQSGAGSRGSVAQYSAATADARVNVIIEEGIQALKTLDTQEQELKAAAQSAYATQDFKILDAINNQIETKRQEQEAVAKELNKKIADEQFKAKQAEKQATRDSAVADLYSQGITDPVKMLNYLNYDEKGNQVGDFTAKEIQETIKNIANGLGTDVSGLDQTTKEFYRLKQANALPAYITSATQNEGEQLLAYVKARTGAETKGKATSAGTRTSGGVSGGGYTGNGAYANDLEALIGNAKNTISTKFGQQSFQDSINRARNDSDKISTIATIILKNSPAQERTDYNNQVTAIKQIEKAVNLIDQGVQTGALNAGKQYVYNVVGKDYDPNLAKVNQLIISAIQPYRNSITGAAWGDQEDSEYQQLFGSTKYSPAELKQRLEGVKQILKDKTVGSLRSQVDPLSQYQNIFDLTGSQHLIQSGDTLNDIASKNGTTVDVLLALNPGINPNNLVVGGKLNMPIDNVHYQSQNPLNLNIQVANSSDPLGIK